MDFLFRTCDEKKILLDMLIFPFQDKSDHLRPFAVYSLFSTFVTTNYCIFRHSFIFLDIFIFLNPITFTIWLVLSTDKWRHFLLHRTLSTHERSHLFHNLNSLFHNGLKLILKEKSYYVFAT